MISYRSRNNTICLNSKKYYLNWKSFFKKFYSTQCISINQVKSVVGWQYKCINTIILIYSYKVFFKKQHSGLSVDQNTGWFFDQNTGWFFSFDQNTGWFFSIICFKALSF